jgi:hypothetical protein
VQPSKRLIANKIRYRPDAILRNDAINMGELMRTVIAILLLLTAPAFADRASEDALLTKARGNTVRAPAIEKAALAAAAGRVERNGDVLTLHFLNRTTQRLTDHRKACEDTDPKQPIDDCLIYQLSADLPSRHAIVVTKNLYEGCGEALVFDDRSGRSTKFADVPVFSPDGQRLLIQNDCEADGSASDNHLEIWKRAGDGWVLEWAYTDQQAFAADKALKNVFHSEVLAWSGDEITMRFIDRGDERHWTGTLTRIKGRWVLKAGKLHSP